MQDQNLTPDERQLLDLYRTERDYSLRYGEPLTKLTVEFKNRKIVNSDAES